MKSAKTGNTTPDYLSFFCLEQEPFLPEPDIEFDYITSSLTQRINLLHHLLEFSHMMFLVTGPEGSGKTLFTDRLLAGGGPHWQACKISATRQLQPQQILEQLFSDFGLSYSQLQGAETHRDRLHAHLKAADTSGKLPILIIDDTDKLPINSLTLIAELVSASDKLLRLPMVLTGEPDLSETIENIQNQSSPNEHTHVIDLPAFDEEQTGDYIHHRLHIAGLKGDSPFSPEIIKGIFKTSGGIPSKINILARQVLVNVTTASNGNPLADLAVSGKRFPVMKLTAALLSVTVLSFVSWWLFSNLEPGSEEPALTSLVLPAPTKITPYESLEKSPTTQFKQDPKKVEKRPHHQQFLQPIPTTEKENKTQTQVKRTPAFKKPKTVASNTSNETIVKATPSAVRKSRQPVATILPVKRPQQK